MNIPKTLTIDRLLKERAKELELAVLAGAGGLNNAIRTPELNRPGLAFAGFYDVFSHDRIQILGNTEMSYLANLHDAERATRMRNTLKFDVPCFMVTNGNEIVDDIAQHFNERNIPLLRTTLPTTRFVNMLITYLERVFAPALNVHGELVDVYGMGSLIMGRSGVGKSECALELIERGHRLVADDIVILRRLSKEELVGRSNEIARYHMEIRGLGILNIEKLFGIASVVEEKKVDLVVQLERWDENVEYERLGIDDNYRSFFDVRIPEFIVPVQPGRNISIMVEMAALTQRLKNSGYHAARQMEESIMKRLAADPSTAPPSTPAK